MRELGQRLEFKRAGNSDLDQVDAAVLLAEIDKLYLDWGLQGIEGIEIDGEAGDPEALIASGPEELCKEIVREIKRECGLSQEERKN